MSEANAKGTVLIVGGGIAGLAASLSLVDQGLQVELVERELRLGGRVARSAAVFPSMDKGQDIIDVFLGELGNTDDFEATLGAEVSFIRRHGRGFEVEMQLLPKGGEKGCVQMRTLNADAIIIATGLEPIDASAIPEFGYPKFVNVVLSTSFDEVMEKGLRRPSDMEKVKSVAFVQCVGSRVETRGVPYCSAICCMNAIKNAIAAKEMDNSVDVFVLYIDIRTHGKGYEALYKAAREKGVRFIRGQPSMVVKKPGSERLLVVGENTLIKELYEIPVDLVVLSVGLRQSHGTDELLGMLEISTDRDGLIGEDSRFESTSTSAQGVFVAGCAEAPKDVRDSIAQGEAAALAATRYIVASRQGKSIS
jgi:heterodisulfide reductase subunit A